MFPSLLPFPIAIPQSQFSHTTIYPHNPQADHVEPTLLSKSPRINVRPILRMARLYGAVAVLLPSEWCIKLWHKSKDAACNGKYHRQYGPALCILRIHVHIWTCDPPNAGLKNVIHKKVTPFAASMKQKIDVQGSEYLPVVANHPEGKVQEAKSLPSGV